MPLDRYYEKRTADQTPEPYGGRGVRVGVFVVQKHAARRLHYDLRLEHNGVLMSWVIPRAPSSDPSVKRLAVRTEDHPVDYVDFEGLIPEGNYGAGAMIVWDRGEWTALEDPATGLEEGKLLFELRGYKLRGVFTLVKTKGEGSEWLLIKKPDAHARPEGSRSWDPRSILSGLTVEQIAEGFDAGEDLDRRLIEAKVPQRRVRLDEVQPMLAETADEPFSRAGWLFELKYDGFRLLIDKSDGEVKLRYRSGLDSTRAFPEIVKAVSALPFDDLLIDSEVVVLGTDGKPSFHSLQKRVQLMRERDIQQATVSLPATVFAFDLLRAMGRDLREMTLTDRKAFLQTMLPAAGILRFSEHVEREGEALFQRVLALKLEGLMAKRADSPYRAGRTSDWLKVRVERADDFVIVGFSEPKGTRVGFGGLHLGQYVGRELVYQGRVGSGFNQKQLQSLREQLDTLRTEIPPVEAPSKYDRVDRWVQPKLVCEVRYSSRTIDGVLRFPVFVRMRTDKTAQDMRTEAESLDEIVTTEGSGPIETPKITNPDKIFFPEDGYTKENLIDLYRELSPWLLPYLEDRPVVLTRFPDGIHGKNFFQKDAPTFIPGWVRTERMWSQHAKREIDYFVCENIESLLYIVNLASIPLHVWSSRVSTLAKPDWAAIDLDPKDAPFADVVTIALAIHELCETIGLPNFVKTSGSSGLHILLPLGRQYTFDQARSLAELICRIIAHQHPNIATLRRSLGRRDGKVYLDFMQNGHGRLIAAPFCVRAAAGAPLSMPVEWSEVPDLASPRQFNRANVSERLASMKADPLLPLLALRPDLSAVLSRLASRLS
ncbi:MAG: DNA ligase D [Myxococcota bacterium]